MPRRGAPPDSARVVAYFAHVLAFADAADPANTAHSKFFFLTLGYSAHTVSRVNDEAQLQLQEAQFIHRAMEREVRSPLPGGFRRRAPMQELSPIARKLSLPSCCR